MLMRTKMSVTPIAIANIYYRFYIVLAALNVCNAIVIWLFYPETKRMSLEELDFFFAKKYSNGSPLKEVELETGKGTDTKQIEIAGEDAVN